MLSTLRANKGNYVSWIITNKATGNKIEIFTKATADKAKANGNYTVEPIKEYLERFNREVKANEQAN